MRSLSRRLFLTLCLAAAVPLAQGFDEVFYPGEMEARNDARNRKDGLQLAADTIDDLRRIAGETGLASRFAF